MNGGTFVGVIPAAGASTRMGAPKALLDAAGIPFVAAAAGSLAKGGCDPVIVVVGPGQEGVAAAARRAGATVMENPDPGEGPITSVRIALHGVPADAPGIALLPVDHPCVRPQTVVALLIAAAERGTPLVVPVFAGARGHPTLFARSLFPALREPGLEGGARTVVRAHLDTATLVEVDDPGVLADMDTPEEYRAAFGLPGSS